MQAVGVVRPEMMTVPTKADSVRMTTTRQTKDESDVLEWVISWIWGVKGKGELEDDSKSELLGG